MLHLRRAFVTSLFALLGTSAVACDGMQEGDYTVYRISYEPTEASASCYDGVDLGPSVTEDSTDLQRAATFILYIGADDTPMLDTGAVVLEGEDNGDDSYTFKGVTKDVEVASDGYIMDSDHDGLDDFEDDPMVDADGDNVNDYYDDDFVDVDGDGLDDRYDDELVDLDGDGLDDRLVEKWADAKYVATTKITIELAIDGELVSGDTKQISTTTCVGLECEADFASSCTLTNDFQGVEIEEADINIGTDGDTMQD